MSTEPDTTTETQESEEVAETIVPVKVGTSVLTPRWVWVTMLVLLLGAYVMDGLVQIRLAETRDKQTESLEVSTQAQLATAAVLALIQDCVIPSTPEVPRECHARGQATTGQAIQTLGRVSLYSLVCVEEKRADNEQELEQCVSEKLEAHGVPPVFVVTPTTTTTTTGTTTTTEPSSAISSSYSRLPIGDVSPPPPANGCMVTVPSLPDPSPTVPCVQLPVG